MLLLDLLYGIWIPPKSKNTIKHTGFSSSKKKSEPVHAKTKVMAVLDEFEWMSNKEIAAKTELQLNTVQTTTNKLYEKKKIERRMRKEAGDIKPVCLYRRK